MFSNGVTGLKMASGYANQAFPNIQADKYQADETLLVMMRALLYDRVPDGETVRCVLKNNTYANGAVDGATPDACCCAFFDGCNRKADHEILIISFDAKENDKCFDKVKAGINKRFGCEFKKDDVLANCFSKVFRADYYICEEKHRSVVVVDRINYLKYHLITSLLSRLLPWLFKEKELTDEEVNMLFLLNQKYSTKDDFVVAINQFADRFDFRSAMIKDKLGTFENKYLEAELRKTKEEIDEIWQYIAQHEDEIRHLLIESDKKRITELGLTAQIDSTECGQLAEFFIHNKGLHLVEVGTDRLEYIVDTVIANYDYEVFDRYIENKGGGFYIDYWDKKPITDKFTEDEIKMLLRDIFDKERIKFHVCAAYRIGGGVRALKNYEFPAELKECCPNQHIQYYACLGNNAGELDRLYKKKDYIGMISQTTLSAQNWNMLETNTNTLFVREMFKKNAPACLELPDGSRVTASEAIAWLKKEQEGAADVETKKEEEAKDE